MDISELIVTKILLKAVLYIHVLFSLSKSTIGSTRIIGHAPPLPSDGVRLYQGLLNRTLPSYAMIAARDFADSDKGAGDGINGGLWCQSANTGSDIGSWQVPDGSTVPSRHNNSAPVYEAHRAGQVGLLRIKSLRISPYQGMYMCSIPDENGDLQTLVVWAATNIAYDILEALYPNPVIDSPVSFSYVASRNVDPPEFTLSFNVSIVPPTYVTCQVDSTLMDVATLSREVIAGEYEASRASITIAPVTIVTVTLRTRQAGDYQCTVSVFRASGSILADAKTAPIRISVTDTPTGLTAVRTGYNTVELSWTAPANSMPPVAGYEVFYTMSGSEGTMSGANTTGNITSASVTLPTSDAYDFFVVAYSEGDALPSKHSIITSIYQSSSQIFGSLRMVATTTNMTLFWITPKLPPTGYTLTSACTLLCDDTPLSHTTTDISGSSTSATLSGLLPGSLCNNTMTVYSDTSNGSSMAFMVTTLSQIPSAAPTGLGISSLGNSSIVVTWDELSCPDQNGPLSGYDLQYTADGDAPATTSVPGGTTIMHQLTGLTACTSYTMRIAAKNDAGTGGFSSPISFITNRTASPGPVSFNKVSTTVNKIKIAWERLLDATTDLRYVVKYMYNGLTTRTNTSETVLELPGLGPGKSVVFTVIAVDACGTVGPETMVSVSTDVLHELIVAVTDAFTIDAISNTSVNASWTSVNGTYLDHYTVYYNRNPAQSGRRKGQSNEQMAVFPVGSSSGVIRGLEEEQDYLFSLAVAFNINGQVLEGERTESVQLGISASPAPASEPPGTVATHSTNADTPGESETHPIITETPEGLQQLRGSPTADEGTPTLNPAIAGWVALGAGLVIVVAVVLIVIIIILWRRQRVQLNGLLSKKQTRCTGKSKFHFEKL